MSNKLGKALTWEELANLFDKGTGRRARTLPMETVFDWAAQQTDKFSVSDDGTIHKIRRSKTMCIVHASKTQKLQISIQQKSHQHVVEIKGSINKEECYATIELSCMWDLLKESLRRIEPGDTTSAGLQRRIAEANSLNCLHRELCV